MEAIRAKNATLAADLTRALALEKPPLQISYAESPVASVPRRSLAPPSVCTYFALGLSGPLQAPAADHGQCEIGGFVYGLPAEGEFGQRLGATISWMETIGYLGAGETAAIPRRPRAAPWAAYAPLGSVDLAPEVVLLFPRAQGLMWILEAFRAAWPDKPLPPTLLRPMCAVVPAVSSAAPVAVSVGCAGSRLYMGLPPTELVVAVHGPELPRFVDALRRIRAANEEVAAEDEKRMRAGASRPA